MPMQIKRRLGGTEAPPATLAEGQLSYMDPQTPAFDGLTLADDSLYIGSEGDNAAAVVRTLVSRTRQLELAGSQTISGTKTIAVTALKITGASATNQILTVSNIANGDLAWSTAPSGGLTSVAVDGVTIDGDGNTNPLEVISVPEHDISITTRAAQSDGSITTINITAAAYDATGDAIMANFAITRLDDGTY